MASFGRSTAEACDAEECYNSFNYWHVPPASPSEVGLPDDEPMHDSDLPSERFDDFHYWRPPLPNLTEAGITDVDQAPNTHAFEEQGHDENEQRGSEDEEDEGPDEVEPLSLISGDAGNRLLGILGRLSQHLGADSSSHTDQLVRAALQHCHASHNSRGKHHQHNIVGSRTRTS